MIATEIPTPDPRPLDTDAQRFAAVLAGRYVIKREIGRGGMGIVYLARDLRLDRLVAIKTLPPHLAGDATVRERFLRETRTAGGLSHPNIVPIHGADEIDDQVFFVMGYVDGDSMATRIRAHGRTDARALVPQLLDVASALTYAHARGIVHRDVKAENILIDRATGRALVTDFGIARLAEAAPLTATGQLLGTVYYVSPEQVSGEAIDGRSDIYSLGVVGYFALSGRFPFDSELASAVLVAHVTKMPPPLITVARDTPQALAAVIDRCLAKDPGARFATCEEFAAALTEAVSAPHVSSRAPVPAPPTPLLSDTEAHAVWRRAAELEALTGVRPRPAPVVRTRDEERDRARASGLGVSEVRVAASEAGIAPKYVEHALAEHGLTGAPPSAPPVEKAPPRRGLFARLALRRAPAKSVQLPPGSAKEIVLEAVTPGEMNPRDFDRLLNTLRVASRQIGTVAARSRELSWECEDSLSRLNVSVVPTGGATTIRVAQRLVGLRRLVTAGSIVVGGFAGLFTAVFIDEGLRGPDEAAFFGFVTVALATLMQSRRVFRWFRNRRESQLQTTMQALIGQVRESIDERSPRDR